MKRRFLLNSIYAKFTAIFLGIWWFINTMTFSVVLRVMRHSELSQMFVKTPEFRSEFRRVREITSVTFLISFLAGTVIILLAVRSFVKPIKRLSIASQEVAKGNFDIEVRVDSNDEIGQLTSDFNLMTKELKNIDVLRKDFVSNVSHEFKTPITSIKGFARLIRDGRLNNDQLFEYSDIIVNESERLSLLSSNLLKLSELDSKLIREQSKLYFLDEQIRKAVLILEVQWSKKNIEFDIELDEIKINGDEHLLQEVWLNLIQNAIKFSGQNGIIKISLHKTGNCARVEIHDNGIGISEEDKTHIFERFFKGDKSRSKDGNGLGLVIVKRIVELSNGKINVDSELGKGSTFVVELPL